MVSLSVFNPTSSEQIRFGSSDSNYWGLGRNYTTGYFELKDRSDNVRFTIDYSSGYTGIGTTSPDRMLHVVTTGDVGAIIEDDDNAVLLFRDTGATAGRQSAGLKWNSPKFSIVSTTDAYASQTEFLTVDMSTGYVGIGTNSPSAKLDVAYDSSDQSAMLEVLRLQRSTSGTSANNMGGYINIQGEDNSGSMRDAGHIGAILTDVSSTNIASAIVFKTRTANGSLTEKLRIDGSGNIGVGTTTPRYKLDVWGDMAIGTSTSQIPALYVDSGRGGGVISYSSTTIANYLSVGTSTTPTLFVDSGNGYAVFSTPNVSSALTINEPRIEATLPLYVNVEGNVGFAYDLEFTDPDLAKIIAGGNLAIEAGTPGMYQDLRLKTRGLGNVLVDISNASSSYTGGFKVLGSNGVLMTVGEPGQVKLRNDTGLVIGEVNQKVIDDFEDATTVDWTSYNSTYVAANSAEASTVKVGNYSLNISATTSSEDVYVVKNFSSAQDWSAYERLGFWIRASKIATSSATTTQIISAAIYGSANNVTSTHQIYIQEANAWQYEEWTIDDIYNSTSVDRIAFRMDVGGTSVINFYIDQIRAYNSNERSGEMFVGKDGSLTLLGRGTVEIGRADGSSNKPAVKVDSAVVEFNQPMSVNVGGDVGINYDLQFLNTGASYITSEGSLWIQAGDSNHADNLYLTTGGTGDVVVELSTSSQSFIVAGTNRYLDVTYAGVVGIGETSPLAFGDFNSQIIDNMEGSVLDWRSYNTTYVTTSTETSAVKVGSQALNIAATTASEDVFVAKSYSSTQDWSPYERISFWIRASQLATSTATTTQMISVGIFGSANNASTTHQINIQKEDRWQYEEWNIDNIQNSTSVDKIFFRIDVGSISSTNFYIDHIRLYDSDERAADLFVDKDGTLVVTGRNSVELYAPQAGAGNLPGVKVDAAVVELGQPLSVNVGGDVGFDYDLQFLNTGLAQITSEGPLRIAAGDSNHSENLTLTTGGAGDIIVELTASSSAFMITHAWAASTTVPFILNSESNSTTTSEMDKLGVLFQIISDYSTDENTVFSIDASGNFYYDRGAYTPAADVAENYYVNDENIRGGDVVCLAGSALTVEKCSSAYESDLLGVISTQPALLMGNDMTSARPVALNGRVPVKISLENGPIAIGDPLTSASSTPGVAMKATSAGKILGYALESFDESSTSSDMIYAFINLQDRSAGDLSVYENTEGGLEIRTLTQSGLSTLFTIDEDGALVVSKIKTQQLCVGSVCVTENEFMEVFGAGVGEVLIPEDGGVCTNGTNQPCSSEVGACQIGVQICESGAWGECIGAIFPTDEICDEVDNDCDGEVDEGGICVVPESEPISTSTDPIIGTSTDDIATSTATTTP
ncbi:MAG: putative metal-binding motif-containing protein [Methylococcales bacterium]|nr:putative metal-binding motif-containing protein [Methylococcales bacterium]